MFRDYSPLCTAKRDHNLRFNAAQTGYNQCKDGTAAGWLLRYSIEGELKYCL